MVEVNPDKTGRKIPRTLDPTRTRLQIGIYVCVMQQSVISVLLCRQVLMSLCFHPLVIPCRESPDPQSGPASGAI